MKLLTAHTRSAALASGGSDQTISTEVPLAASIGGEIGWGAADVTASNLRMSGLFSACSEIHAASCRQPRNKSFPAYRNRWRAASPHRRAGRQTRARKQTPRARRGCWPSRLTPAAPARTRQIGSRQRFDSLGFDFHNQSAQCRGRERHRLRNASTRSVICFSDSLPATERAPTTTCSQTSDPSGML